MTTYDKNYIKDYTYCEQMKVIKHNEEIDSGYGLDNTIISDENIEELKKGNLLWFNDGEYSHTISYKREDKDKDKEVFNNYFYFGLHRNKEDIFKYIVDNKEVSLEEFNEIFYETMVKWLKEKGDIDESN